MRVLMRVLIMVAVLIVVLGAVHSPSAWADESADGAAWSFAPSPTGYASLGGPLVPQASWWCLGGLGPWWAGGLAW